MLRRAKRASIRSRRSRAGPNIRSRAVLLAASLAAAILAACGTAAAATARCTIAKIAELPVRVLHGKVVVDGAVNGKPVNIMLDTGATATLVTRPAADRLGLIRQKGRGGRMYGMGGTSEVESALVDEFKVGDATVKSRYMMVTGEHEIGDGVAVILGEDFFHVVDVEFDLAHNAVRLFRSKDCDGSSLAYWATAGASETPIERVAETNPNIVLTVQINGQPVRALLDSGAGASVLNRSDAERTGVAAQGSGGTSGGLGPSFVDWSFGSVNSIAIGDEKISDTKMAVADLWKGARYASGIAPPNVDRPSMLLGVDFLLAHRVMIAHSQQKLYFTYVGGPVFQGRDPRNDKGDPDRTIADADAAIRSDPQNATAYFRRGNAWYEKKDYDRAIADYDTVIRIEPARASAFNNRGGARLAKGDDAQAIADATRAIEIDPKLSSALLTRGVARRRSGDFEGAIADWTRAIELAPGQPQAYNHLAWTWATAERPAVRDGPRAVQSALKACELSQWKNPSYLDTLAAAYARDGKFDEAVKWQRKAMESPGTASDDKARERLRLYEENKAWPAD